MIRCILLFLHEAKLFSLFAVYIKNTQRYPPSPGANNLAENFIYTFTKMQICKLVLPGFIQQTKSFLCPNERVMEEGNTHITLSGLFTQEGRRTRLRINDKCEALSLASEGLRGGMGINKS